MSTSKPLPDYTAYQVGAGRVDVKAARRRDPITATGSAYFGFDAWPHATSRAGRRGPSPTPTAATAAVTLHLAETANVAGGPYDVDPTADAGTPAPAGMFTLSADTVTVPAHGTATVTATAPPEPGRRSAAATSARSSPPTDGGHGRGPYPVSACTRRTSGTPCTSPSRTAPGKPAAGYHRAPAVRPRSTRSIVHVDDTGTLDLRLPAGHLQRVDATSTSPAATARLAGPGAARQPRDRPRPRPDADPRRPQGRRGHGRGADVRPRTGCCPWTGTAPTAATARIGEQYILPSTVRQHVRAADPQGHQGQLRVREPAGARPTRC